MSYITHTAKVYLSNSVVKNSVWLDTINTWQRYNNPTLFGPFLDTDSLFLRSIRPHNQHTFIGNLVISSTDMYLALNSAFSHSRTLFLNQKSHFQYPLPSTPVTPAQIFFHPPLFNLKTSTYIDMELYLNSIYLRFLGEI